MERMIKQIKKMVPKIKKSNIKQLEVKLPYNKHDKILNQRSGFFKEGYTKEALLSWS